MTAVGGGARLSTERWWLRGRALVARRIAALVLSSVVLAGTNSQVGRSGARAWSYLLATAARHSASARASGARFGAMVNCSELVQWPWSAACSWGGHCVDGVGCVCRSGFSGVGDGWLLAGQDCQIWQPALHALWLACLVASSFSLVLRLVLLTREYVLGAPLRARNKRGVLGDPAMRGHLFGLFCDVGQVQLATYKVVVGSSVLIGSSWSSLVSLLVGSTTWWLDMISNKIDWYIVSSLRTSDNPAMERALARYLANHVRIKAAGLFYVGLIFELPFLLLVAVGPSFSSSSAIMHVILLSVWLVMVAHLWMRVLAILERSLADSLELLTPTGKADEPVEALLRKVRKPLRAGALSFIWPQLAMTLFFICVPWLRSFMPVTFPLTLFHGLAFNLIIMRMQFKPRSSYPRRRAIGASGAPSLDTPAAKPSTSHDTSVLTVQS